MECSKSYETIDFIRMIMNGPIDDLIISIVVLTQRRCRGNSTSPSVTQSRSRQHRRQGSQ